MASNNDIILAATNLELLRKVEAAIRAAFPLVPIAKGKLARIEDKHDGSFQINFEPVGEALPAGNASHLETGRFNSDWQGFLPGRIAQ